MRQIDNIIIHCSATPPSLDIGAETIEQWHRANGWLAIGYHYIIKRDGSIQNGRDLDGDGNILEEVGAHAYGYNSRSVGICLVGGVGDDGMPDANFSLMQYISLKQCIEQVMREVRHQRQKPQIIGHRDISNKACPSFNVQELLRE